MGFCSFLIWSAILMVVSTTAIIESDLQKAYDTRGEGGLENVMITFETRLGPVIEVIERKNYSTLHEKRTALTEAQQKYAKDIQGPLKKLLKSRNADHETLWINNKMYVPSASADLVQEIAAFPGVAKIEKEEVIALEPIDDDESEDYGNETINPEAHLEWGIERIHAPKVWSKGIKGKGIVVASIDTGVRYTHEALKGRWRKKHGWFNPYNKTATHPFDDLGHGTHTMGTITGTHGIGVAPEATWITCKGCGNFGCLESHLIKCGQWIQCPTDHLGKHADCKLAPHLVSNSWGGGHGSNYYDGVIASWQAAGIIPVFSIGNEGPGCGTAHSPGDRDKVIAVGSIDKDSKISHFSGFGPTKDRKIKPDIAAPGGRVRSASYKSDHGYRTLSGTSMACPHVSGVVALMHQKSKHLNYAHAYKVITSSAHRQGLDLSKVPKQCAGATNCRFPNNVYGYGLVCAEKAVGTV